MISVILVTYEDLLSDINKLNEIAHNYSIVLIKDSFQRFPNRFLVYEDKRWECKLFLNYKENPNNKEFIKNHLSEIDGKKYRWMTITELEMDEEVRKKNRDILEFVKELV